MIQNVTDVHDMKAYGGEDTQFHSFLSLITIPLLTLSLEYC